MQERCVCNAGNGRREVLAPAINPERGDDLIVFLPNHRFEIGKGWSQPEIPDYFRPSLKLCLAFFPNVDRSLEGFDGIMAAQECLPDNKKRDEFAAAFGVLAKLWSAINPDPFLTPYRQDYK